MFDALPQGWKPAPQPVLDLARDAARQVLEDEDTVKRVTQYYRRESNYAGATFSQLNPNDPFSIGGSDLLAVHMLSVDIPQVAVRRLTEPCSASAHLARLLGTDALDVDLNLQSAGFETLEAMSEFYVTVKAALRPVGAKTSSPKVTASKICARKRPDLFPIMDKRVLRLLGTWDMRDYGMDWQVFRHLLEDEALMAALRNVVDQAAAIEGVSVGDPNCMLRHLDVALWTSTLR
ncbi:DUF6308 family protein [uncultured Phycicoccus sp.]|uniref:DUF6308 family protein n=1 Tax=uncultured Phycicoccus sp. TaxID=661422 RepID=UPI00262E8627|nr:DUF6308 family protein [uncultured Phycicoccus sp.]